MLYIILYIILHISFNNTYLLKYGKNQIFGIQIDESEMIKLNIFISVLSLVQRNNVK